jgi:hypothetical protein
VPFRLERFTLPGSKRRDKKNPGVIWRDPSGYANTVFCGMDITDIMISEAFPQDGASRQGRVHIRRGLASSALGQGELLEKRAMKRKKP